MRRSSVHNNSIETILSISPMREDHQVLKNIFRQHSFRNYDKWKLVKCSSLEWAKTLLRTNEIPITICECDLEPGIWKDLLEATLIMHQPAMLIVTSRLADERLWSEVLNLGGFDVLAKPFDRTEVMRVIESAIRRWQGQYGQLGSIHRTLRVAG